MLLESLAALAASRADELAESRVVGTVVVEGLTMNMLAIQVGYGHQDGPFFPRLDAEDEITGDCIGAVDPSCCAAFDALHTATRSEGHLETVFVGGIEYALFCFPLSI